MAAKKQVAVAKTAGSKSIATIDQELANEIATIKDQIGTSSGNKLKVEPTGDFILPDGRNLGSEIQVVVVDFASSNKFYDMPYNPQSPTPPACYSIGKVISNMVPEDDAPQKQHEDCRTCPLNQFGSGNNGKSKACKNERVLAVLLVDPEIPDAHNELDAPIYTMTLPPTAIRSFDGAVGHIARALAKPPIGAILTVTAKNKGTYAEISFIDPVPNPDYAMHAARRGEVQDLILRKPDFASYEAKAPPRRTAQPARRAGARR